MIKQYKVRDINKAPELHKEVFIKYSDMQKLFEQFIGVAVDAGADIDKLVVDNDEKAS